MNTQPYLVELKDLLLLVYDGDTVSRIVVERLTLTILGLNVYASFSRVQHGRAP